MKLKDIDFGQVTCASGAMNYTGTGWWYSNLLKRAGLLSTKGMGLVTKTFTLGAIEGHMPLEDDGMTPIELYPRCIRVRANGDVNNAVGLSGMGLEFYLPDLFALQEKFGLSIMALGNTLEERMRQRAMLYAILKGNAGRFLVPFYIQENFSCPNTGHDVQSGVEREMLEAANLKQKMLPDMAWMPKVTFMVDPGVILRIAEHEAFDGLCSTNTIPWGTDGYGIKWRWLLRSSSLVQKATGKPGGLSGPKLLKPNLNWLKKLRDLGYDKPINFGGGLRYPWHFKKALNAKDSAGNALLQPGRDSIFIGSGLMTGAPWVHFQSMIDLANEKLSEKGNVVSLHPRERQEAVNA